MCGREVSLDEEMGTLERISPSPSQPNEVTEGLAMAGFCLDGALPMNAALILEKS